MYEQTIEIENDWVVVWHQRIIKEVQRENRAFARAQREFKLWQLKRELRANYKQEDRLQRRRIELIRQMNEVQS